MDTNADPAPAAAARTAADDDPEPPPRVDRAIEDHHFVRPTVSPVSAADVRTGRRDG